MKLDFLRSDDRTLSKTFTCEPNGVRTTAYPLVRNFSSITEEISTLRELEARVRYHAAQGHCLLKGQLDRPLENESRAGHTDPEQFTDWVCLDLDGVAFDDVDSFLSAIGAGNTQYVRQWSSSMKVKDDLLRCHIFMALEQPAHPKILKMWLQHLNLSIPALRSQMQLTKSGNGVTWPLDVTTCQSDKILYIAPPQFIGMNDPMPAMERTIFYDRQKTHLVLPDNIPSQEAIRAQVNERINELRAEAGMPKRKTPKYKFSHSGDVEYLENPDTAVVTGIKEARGFVYFNLNNGDSWGYYHPEDNPEFIFNFKGEPVYRTQDLIPEYWYKLMKKQLSEPGVEYFAFRDFRTSNYFNGSYDGETLKIAMAKNESQLRHFMKQHGQPFGDFVPDWDLVWEPHADFVVSHDLKKVNTYQPSDFELVAKKRRVPRVQVIPPTINKVIRHVFGEDEPTIEHFLNWLACIVQFKTRTGTAWVLQGTQGTGKGVLFHQIITPLLGEQNVVSKRMEELESEFTGFMENKFVVFIDEIEAGKSLYHSKVTAKLKNLIVEPTISVRRMYTPAYMTENYASMIFASNKADPVEVSPDDRRFNVGPYQTEPISLTAEEVDELIPSELDNFFAYLTHFEADRAKARTPLQSEARDLLINISRKAIDEVSDALLEGNIEFFVDQMLSDKALGMVGNMQALRYQPYKELIDEILETERGKLTRDELFIIYEWCVGNMPQTTHKLTAMLKHHKIHMKQMWINGKNVRGIETRWYIPEELKPKPKNGGKKNDR